MDSVDREIAKSLIDPRGLVENAKWIQYECGLESPTSSMPPMWVALAGACAARVKQMAKFAYCCVRGHDVVVEEDEREVNAYCARCHREWPTTWW